LKTILITGASSGIGRALAVQAARAGFAVYAVGRNIRALAALAGQISEEGGTIYTDVTDISDPNNAPGLIGRAVGAFGHVDVLVNNAGAAAVGPLATQSDEQMRVQFGTHVIGPVALTREALPTLRSSRGHVFMIGSGVARVPIGGMGAYPPSKAALRSATSILRRELVSLDVAVTYVDPGAVDTGFMTRAGMPGAPRDVLVSPEQVARKILLAISTRPRVLNIAPLQSAAVAIAEAFPAIAEAVMERNPNLVGTGPSLAAIEIARDSNGRGEKIALPSARLLPFAPDVPPLPEPEPEPMREPEPEAAAVPETPIEATTVVAEPEPIAAVLEPELAPAPEPAPEAAAPQPQAAAAPAEPIEAAVVDAVAEEAILPTLDGTIDAPIIGSPIIGSPIVNEPVESLYQARAEATVAEAVVAETPAAEERMAETRLPDTAPWHEPVPVLEAAAVEPPPYVQPPARWQYEPPESAADALPAGVAPEPALASFAPPDEPAAVAPDVEAAMALPTEDDDLFVPDESSEQHNVEPSATGKSFDAAIEPLLRRMERSNMTIDFVRSMMIPDAVVDVGDAAMRWAGMPNKHERALTSEVFFALAEWGFLAPRADGRYRVLYPADDEPRV
jgi:short-subunit dehydrogenase